MANGVRRDILFQSTRPRGRTRLKTEVRRKVITGFNPRVLAGGRDVKCQRLTAKSCCFNPRVLAGGRDGYGAWVDD